MTGIRLAIFAALGAFLVGIIVGYYAVLPSLTGGSHPQSGKFESTLPANPVLSPKQTTALDESPPRSTPSLPSNENIIADLKTALIHADSRHSYAAFSKLIESVDEKNIQPVLAFAQSVPKDEKSRILLSLLVGRWAEFDPQAAIAYAQNTPGESSRNSMLTSALSGWAEHNLPGASAWAQQLPLFHGGERSAIRHRLRSKFTSGPSAPESLLANLQPLDGLRSSCGSGSGKPIAGGPQSR
jgi:hypothetical protein